MENAAQDDSRRLDRGGPPADRELVARLEVELLDPAVRRDPSRLDQLLHPDFIEHGASGRVWTRDAIIAELPLEDDSAARTTSTELETHQVTADSILVTFRTTSTRVHAVRSSLWVRTTEGSWRIRFHQGTPVDPDELAPVPRP